MRILAALAVLLLVPAVAAQQTESTMSVSVSGSLGTVKLGQTASVPVTAELDITNVFCPQPVDGVITFAVADQPSALAGLSGTLTITSVPFTITGGAATSASATAETVLNVSVGTATTPNHDHTFNVTASFQASDLSGTCVAVTASGATVPDAKGSVLATMKTGAAPVSTNSTGPDGSESTSDGGKKSPSFSMPMLGLLIVALALISRRSK